MIGAESAPYTDMPVEVDFEDDRSASASPASTARCALTPAQGLALLAAGAALPRCRAPTPTGHWPALAKLAAVLGIDPNESSTSTSARRMRACSTTCGAAVDDERQVELDYWSAGRDDRTHRVVDPWRVFSDEGAWYLQAWCHRAGDARVFRVDRMQDRHRARRAVRSPRAACPDAAAYSAGADDRGSCSTSTPTPAGWPRPIPVDTVEDLADGGSACDAGRRAGVPGPPAAAARPARARWSRSTSARAGRPSRPTRTQRCWPATGVSGAPKTGGIRTRRHRRAAERRSP